VKRLLFPLPQLLLLQHRRYHSYGIAVDLVPKSYGGRHVYWRWMVPEAVVRAFEYRPEILLLE
jgi:hypothetical protein